MDVGNKQRHQPADDPPQAARDECRVEEVQHAAAKGELIALGYGRQGKIEGDDRGGIVKQAFGLQGGDDAPRDAGGLGHGIDCDGVRWGDGRTDEDGRSQADTGQEGIGREANGQRGGDHQKHG